MTRISVFGLGYVGCVSAVCFAERGHEVIGVDVNSEKTVMLGRGEPPVLEERLGELLAEALHASRLRTTVDPMEAVAATEVSLVCVGTPSSASGSISTMYLERVSEQIGAALAPKTGRHTVVFRSTMLPGTCERRLVPIIEHASGRRAGADFGVAVNPEFLREGTGVRDFFDPPKTVVGEFDEASGDVVTALYEGFPGPLFRVPPALAEMTKYVDNGFHALKIGFANEIGAICRGLGIDSHRLMEIFRADRKLNISDAYLAPGFAFGGSCLPKDLRALVHEARRNDVEVPILEHVLPSNELHVRRALGLVAATGSRQVSLFGLAFKAGTDDLRESPLVELAERLLGKGFDLRIYDPNVSVARLLGTNRSYMETHLPHLADLLAPLDVVLAHAEVCVVGSRAPEVSDALAARDGLVVIDLVRLPDAASLRGTPGYVGVGW